MFICLLGFIENEAIMIPTHRGKNILMYNRYTYSQINNSNHWWCSSKASGCNARMRRYPNGQIEIVHAQHTHQPPRYMYHSGQYIKI